MKDKYYTGVLKGDFVKRTYECIMYCVMSRWGEVEYIYIVWCEGEERMI